MKRYLTMIGLMALMLSLGSCNLLNDVFDSDDQTEKEFSSEEWMSIEKNVIEFESIENETLSLEFPDSGKCLIYPDYETGKACLMFESFKIIKLATIPEGEPYYKYVVSLIEDAYQLNLTIEDVPFKVGNEGIIEFSQKIRPAILSFGHMSGCSMCFYNKVNCNVSISGEMTQQDCSQRLISEKQMTGEINIKIKDQDGRCNLLSFKQLAPSILDNSDPLKRGY